AVAQAYYNKEAGTKRIATETGAGQWGSALSMACSFFGIGCQVFMVRASYEQKPYRRIFMETFGAEVIPSPSPTTRAGKTILEAHPDSTGSLGIAISEAVEVAATSNGAVKYSLGSVLNHVLLHQTVIGLEAKEQMKLAGESDPHVVIGCVGGGSSYAGLAYPFIADRLAGRTQTRFVAAEPAACPTLTKGRYAYDLADAAGMTPLLPMYTLGHDFVPAPVHAGGLRYHGDSPTLSLLVKHGHMEARAYTQNEIFEAALRFAHTQGIIPAPESAHGLKAAIDEAIAARDANEERVSVVSLSGLGDVGASRSSGVVDHGPPGERARGPRREDRAGVAASRHCEGPDARSGGGGSHPGARTDRSVGRPGAGVRGGAIALRRSRVSP